MRSPYEVLGMSPSATDAEIRKAFRKLAKTCHPDVKPGDTQAEAKFKEINAAYDLLSDSDKRARFDRGEIDAEGRETFAHAYADARAGGGAGGAPYGFSFGGDGPDDLFDHLFGQRFGGGFNAGFSGAGSMRGRDIRHRMVVDFVEAAQGTIKRLSLSGRSLDVSIPAGIQDGQTLRLKGQGEAAHGGAAAGDLLIEVSVAPHRYFTRKGDDVHLELPVTLAEAVLGGKVTVPTVTGKVAVTVPPGSNNGTTLRLKGKGIRGGDQYVTLRIVLPDKPDAELADFIARWNADHPYDPRAGM